MKWYVYVICAVLIMTGIWATIDGYKLLTAKSSTVGEYVYVSNEIEDILKVELNDFMLSAEEGSTTYSFIKTVEKINFNGNDKTYKLLINDRPCYSQKVTAGAITGNFKQDYLNTDGEIVSTSNLNVSVQFFEANTLLTFKLNDENNSLLNFESYVSNNGLILKVVEVVE